MPSPASGRESSLTSASPVRHADPQLEPLREREVADRERGADGSFRIILVRDRGAEQRHRASPMNFSTVPPWRSSSCRVRSW